jgi:predicted nucleotidyltransferase
MPPLKVFIDTDAIGEFCRRWNVTELSLFGSALRDDFGPDSDVDVLVTFAADARPTLFDMVHMKEQLEAVLGHSVDLVSRRGVEQSRNYLRRRAILSSAEPIYHVER